MITAKIFCRITCRNPYLPANLFDQSVASQSFQPAWANIDCNLGTAAEHVSECTKAYGKWWLHQEPFVVVLPDAIHICRPMYFLCRSISGQINVLIENHCCFRVPRLRPVRCPLQQLLPLPPPQPKFKPWTLLLQTLLLVSCGLNNVAEGSRRSDSSSLSLHPSELFVLCLQRVLMSW